MPNITYANKEEEKNLFQMFKSLMQTSKFSMTNYMTMYFYKYLYLWTSDGVWTAKQQAHMEGKLESFKK